MLQRARKKNSGLSLVEVAIVLVLIGLLVAGLVSAQQLIAAAKVRATVREIENKISAIESFVEKFRAYPGDMLNAETFFTAAATDNGDGNARISYAAGTVTADEGNLAWQHLALAGLIEGSFQATGANDILDVNLPRSGAAGGGAGYAIDHDNTLGNHLILGRADGNGPIDGVVLTPEFAYAIDKKMDDGLPAIGIIQSNDGNACRNNGVNPPEYNYNQDDLLCYLLVTLN